jgi:hypothetical protein
MSNFARIISNRLDEVRRSMAIKAIDEFDLGIDCRLANEEEWLEDLLSKLECE